MVELDYIKDKKGNLKAVVVPIELWKRLLPEGVYDEDELPEAIEDYCFNKAMDEAKATPLLTKSEALAELNK